jgi:hypothetical protein
MTTAEYEITKDDIIGFNLYHSRHSPAVRRQYLRAWLIPALIWLIKLLRTFLDLLPLFSAIPLYLLYFPWAYHRRLRKMVGGMVGEGQNRGYSGRRRTTISPEGITESGEFGEHRTVWRAVERLVRVNGNLYVYTNAVSAVIVPRRAFENPSDFDAFTDSASKYHETAKS